MMSMIPLLSPTPLSFTKRKILFLASNPKNLPHLRLDEEVRTIDEELERVDAKGMFVLAQKWAVRPDDLRRALLIEEPHIVHFAGHSAEYEGVVLEDEEGHPQVVPPEALAELFRLFQDTVKCIVLNSCYSEHQAEALARHIDYVIGMHDATDDEHAIKFALSFYQALGAGRSVERAFEFGCLAFHMAGDDIGQLPLAVLKRRLPGDDIPAQVLKATPKLAFVLTGTYVSKNGQNGQKPNCP